MVPDQNPFGGGIKETLLHPVVVVALIVAGILMLVLPRKYAMVPFLFVSLLTPLGQELYFGGVHIFVMRILILIGCVRMVGTKLSSRVGLMAGGFNSVDTVFLVWALARALASIFLFRFDTGSVIYEGGFLWDALGGYFLLRFLIQNEDDVARAIKTLAAVAVILAGTMLNEKLRYQNIFGYLGGLSVHPEIREGSIRSQGPFAHAILAGVFAATLLPLFIWLWQSGRSKFAGIAGAMGATIMVLTCASSTPLLAYLAVLAGLCFWPLRKNMRTIRWGLVIALITLHIIMKSPVWFLIDHVDLVAGNSGYHRAMLIDTAVKHFRDWWLIGTNQAGNWGFDMWDESNQFVAEAETGGLLTFICFILMISRSLGRLGVARKAVEGDRKKEWGFWLFGVALFSHIVAFFGISYFDQMKISWFALFAMIAAMTSPLLATSTVPQREPETAVGVPRLTFSSAGGGNMMQNRFSKRSGSATNGTADSKQFVFGRPTKT